MKPYLIALGAGVLVGVIYGLLNVRSPAPPVIALVGLMGILLGEQIPALVKRAAAGSPITAAYLRVQHGHHLFGPLPAAENCPKPAETRRAEAGDADPGRAA